MSTTATAISICPIPSCRSTSIRTQGAEWRCATCLAKSPGYQARVLDDPLPFDQRTDPTAAARPEPVRDPWAAAVQTKPALEADDEPKDDASSLGSTPRSDRQDYELIGDLVWWTREHHDAMPTENDWVSSAPFGSDPVGVYLERFGSWENAIDELKRSLLPDDDATPAAAPPPTPAPPVARRTMPADDELLEYLRVWSRANDGRSPTSNTWKIAGTRPDGAPASTVYYQRFGSWKEALERAGLPPNKPGRPAGQKSQPAPAGDELPPAPAETAAAAPPPSEAAVETPAEEGSDAAPPAADEASPASDAIEQQPPTTDDEVVTHYGHQVDRTDLATAARAIEPWPGINLIGAAGYGYVYRLTSENSSVEEVDDARDELRLRYTRALLATFENTEITDETGVAWFVDLADRIERVLGLQETAA